MRRKKQNTNILKELWIIEIRSNPLIEIIPINHDPNTGSNPLHIYREAIEVTRNASNFLGGDYLCIIIYIDRSIFQKLNILIPQNPFGNCMDILIH